MPLPNSQQDKPCAQSIQLITLEVKALPALTVRCWCGLVEQWERRAEVTSHTFHSITGLSGA